MVFTITWLHFRQIGILNSIKIQSYMKVSTSLCFFLALMVLLHQPVAALNWQGTGNMSNSNLTIIWDYIHANLATKIQNSQYDNFNTELSDLLNNAWSPAWNVIMMVYYSAVPYNDVVVYGYAFNNHWMWFNGYQDSSIARKYFSFVIWKDYNCQGWKTVAQSGVRSGFAPAQITKIRGFITALVTEQLIDDDPWTLAKMIVDAVQADSIFAVSDDHAYSIVLAQDYSDSYMYGRVCEVGTNHFYTVYGNNAALKNSKGSFLLFQTR